MSFPFSPLSSPVPFQLGNYNSPQGITQGGFTSASPMVRRLAVPRSASKLPHVNPPARWIGSPGSYQVTSPQNINVLPSMSVLNRYLEEGQETAKEWLKWHNDYNPRYQFSASTSTGGR